MTQRWAVLIATLALLGWAAAQAWLILRTKPARVKLAAASAFAAVGIAALGVGLAFTQGSADDPPAPQASGFAQAAGAPPRIGDAATVPVPTFPVAPTAPAVAPPPEPAPGDAADSVPLRALALPPARAIAAAAAVPPPAAVGPAGRPAARGRAAAGRAARRRRRGHDRAASAADHPATEHPAADHPAAAEPVAPRPRAPPSASARADDLTHGPRLTHDIVDLLDLDLGLGDLDDGPGHELSRARRSRSLAPVASTASTRVVADGRATCVPAASGAPRWVGNRVAAPGTADTIAACRPIDALRRPLRPIRAG